MPTPLISAARPPDVLASVAGYHPSFGALPVAEQPAALALVGDALATLPPPTAVTNRHVADALQILHDGAFTTIFTHVQPDDPRINEVVERRTSQQQAGVYGAGADAGHTVFAGVRFLATQPDGQPDVGAGPVGLTEKGDVSFVFRPEILKRATLASEDALWTGPEHGGIEQLPSVALERVLRDHGAVTSWANQPFRTRDPKPTMHRMDALLAAPHDQAVQTVAHELQHPAAWNHASAYPPFIQAELRNPALSAVVHLYVEPHTADSGETAPPTDAQVAELAALAKQRGIPFTDLRDSSVSE